MYADDTCVNIASEKLNELLTDLKNELEKISHWMRINKLILNTSKVNIQSMPKSWNTNVGFQRQIQPSPSPPRNNVD